MKYFKFDLSEYYTITQKYYFFFDGLFHKEEGIKKEILDKLNIPDSTYRTNRLKKYVKNKNHFILLDYFSYNRLVLNQEYYEECFAKIMYAFYYKDTTAFSILRQEVENFIQQDNYLKPLFILFQMILDIATINNHDRLLEDLKENLEFINLFPEEYFTPKYAYLVLLIKYYCNQRIDDTKLKNYSLEFTELSWLYNFLKGNKEYISHNDYEAIVYYEMSLKDYKENFNISRIVSTINILAFIHNAHDQFELSIEKSSIILQHIFFQKQDKKQENYILTHYLYSLFMLERFYEIKNFFNVQTLTPDALHTDSIIIGILTARRLKMPLYRMNPLLEEVVEQNEDIRIFLNVLEKKVAKYQMKELKCHSTYYFKKIVEKMKLDI